MKPHTRRFALPLNFYLYVLVALLVLLLVVFGLFTLNEVENTAKRLEELERSLAEEEFSLALEQTMSRVESLADELAHWDEVHQQLQNPTYYTYWKMHRLHKQGTLPEFVLDAGLYDHQGNPLANNGKQELLPSHVPLVPNPQVRRDGRHLLLTYEKIIHTDGVSGSLVLVVELMQAIRATFAFSRVDLAAVDMERVPEQPVTPQELHRWIEVQPRNTMVQKEFMTTVQHAVLRLIGGIIFAGLALLLFFSFLIRKPLVRIRQYLNHLRQGEPASSKLLKYQPVAELEEIRSSLQEYHAQLENARQDLDERNRTLWELAHKDPLTGTWNRRAFERDWKNLRSLLEGKRMEIAFLLFDCDHFKAINDSYGHEVGDEVIRVTARRIQQMLRSGDRLYRLGGDEFATIVIECSRHCAEKLAERCLQAMREEDFSRLGIHEPVNLSIGIALARADDLPDLSELKRRADMAMYHAKRPGTRRICIHEPGMDADRGMLYSSQAIHAVQQAIRHGQGIEMHYQPIVDLEGDQVAYLEALVRLRDEEGLFMPAQFFPIVEAHRLEEEFDLAILQALKQEMKSGVIPGHTGLSLNLSANGLLSGRVMELLEELAYHAQNRPLLLEITENTLITRLGDATRQIELARRMGYDVALDDFGSGYSSLRYLASMPVEIIKFDISMTQRIVAGGREREMIQGIVRMIRQAGYRTVAEGIEDEVALSLVRQSGFTHAQGYLFGHPARPQPQSAQETRNSLSGSA